jgi:hypothetical protein
MPSSDLHARLLDDARSYNPSAHHRSLLDPFRDVILLQRAKFMSYDQIAGAFTRNGLKVSGPGVAGYCRRTFTKAEILRERQRLGLESSKEPAATAPSLPGLFAVATPAPATLAPGRRGPKIARDNY